MEEEEERKKCMARRGAEAADRTITKTSFGSDVIFARGGTTGNVSR